MWPKRAVRGTHPLRHVLLVKATRRIKGRSDVGRVLHTDPFHREGGELDASAHIALREQGLDPALKHV